MSNVNYLVFLQNTQTGEEFTAPTSAPKNAHNLALESIALQYPAPNFKCHTAYSEAELNHALQSFNRWPGMTNATSRQVHQPAGQKIAPMRMSLSQAAQQATGAKVEQIKTTPAPMQQPIVSSPTLSPKVEAAPQSVVSSSQKSVIEQLKALRQQ